MKQTCAQAEPLSTEKMQIPEQQHVCLAKVKVGRSE